MILHFFSIYLYLYALHTEYDYSFLLLLFLLVLYIVHLMYFKVEIHVCMEEWCHSSFMNGKAVARCSFYVHYLPASHICQIIAVSNRSIGQLNSLDGRAHRQ